METLCIDLNGIDLLSSYVNGYFCYVIFSAVLLPSFVQGTEICDVIPQPEIQELGEPRQETHAYISTYIFVYMYKYI